jgi:hypothetical protein
MHYYTYTFPSSLKFKQTWTRFFIFYITCVFYLKSNAFMALIKKNKTNVFMGNNK